jgi:hypothetical protein
VGIAGHSRSACGAATAPRQPSPASGGGSPVSPLWGSLEPAAGKAGIFGASCKVLSGFDEVRRLAVTVAPLQPKSVAERPQLATIVSVRLIQLTE